MNEEFRSTSEFEVQRHYCSGDSHYGRPMGHAGEAEAHIGRELPKGTRVRRTVSYEVIEEGPEPLQVSHWHIPPRKGGAQISGLCKECVEAYPEEFVVLACGHGRRVHLWLEQERPQEMVCWDGWAPSQCNGGKPQKIVAIPEHAIFTT